MEPEINLTFAIFRFYCQALVPLFLPTYKGSALRGGFGNVFKTGLLHKIKGNRSPGMIF